MGLPAPPLAASATHRPGGPHGRLAGTGPGIVGGAPGRLPAANGRLVARRHSARVRIVGSSVALLALALLVSTAATRLVLAQRTKANIQQELLNERDEFRSVLAGALTPPTGLSGSPTQGGGQDPASAPPTVARVLATASARTVPERDIAFIGLSDGRMVSRSAAPAPTDLTRDRSLVAAWTAATTTTQGSASSPVGPVEYLAEPFTVPGDTHHGVFVIAAFTYADTAVLDRLTVLQTEMGVLALFLGSGLAWLLAGRVLAPVRQTTELARRITETDLDGRIPVLGNDEVSDLAKTFNSMLDRLQAGLVRQKQLLADVSHELRTPITVVQGNLDTLVPASEDDAATLAVANEELDRMTRMVGDLLELARSEHPDFVQPRPVRVGDLADALATRVTAMGPPSWRVRVDGADRTVEVDTDRVTQAVMELALNAHRHAPSREPLGLDVAADDDELVIRVTDHGLGVPPEQRARVFDRFARLEHPRASGSGLGLAIVAAIAAGHGGSVTVSDRRDGARGATFEVRLPTTVTEPIS